MKKIFMICMLLLMFTGCSTTKETEYVDVIVEKEIEKKYVLPDFQECEKKPFLEKGTLSEFKNKWLDFSMSYKNCEKIKIDYENWIKRNFVKEKK